VKSSIIIEFNDVLYLLGCPEPPFRTGLCFTLDVFLGSHISEVPWPIAAKLCHMIGIWLKRSRKLQKFGRRSPKKYWGPKNMQNFGRFFAPSDFHCEYLWNGLRYPNQRGRFSILPAF